MKRLNLLILVMIVMAAFGGAAKFASDKGAETSKVLTFCSDPDNEQFKGEHDGYAYELWNQNGAGDACMTIGAGALFSGHWQGIDNYLARRGLVFDETQLHHEIGRFSTTYSCIYEPTTESGNSYLSVYGWTVEPLIEFYVVEDWRRWIPSMAEGSELKGTFEIDGSIYDIYESTRYNQPSIIGDATFQQYFSIRRDVRNSGSIDISAHFDKWESLGMVLGKMNEVAFVVEGYMSNGSFEFTELEVKVE
ncbi:glycoside hydrolase family 11 protein [Natronoflexus pectinivorans]|nr:glycoside hydrolase family 11 protein [Natronoflexus pectinivorans]